MWHAWGRRKVFAGFWSGGPKGRPLGRAIHKWEDNINIDRRETGINGTNLIWLVRYRVHWRAFVSTVMNIRVP
jgi:hypothetical protein